MHCLFIAMSRTMLNALYPKETNMLDHSRLKFDLNALPAKTNHIWPSLLCCTSCLKLQMLCMNMVCDTRFDPASWMAAELK